MGKAAWAAALVGLGLGGFLDGIVFHQVLQWHHLLSAFAPQACLGWHVVWDGIFHLATYGVLAAGIVLMWFARNQLAYARTRAFWGMALIGFGFFHIFDAVVFHWVLGLHHINMAQPVLWDLVVFAAGLAITAAGAVLIRSGRSV